MSEVWRVVRTVTPSQGRSQEDGNLSHGRTVPTVPTGCTITGWRGLLKVIGTHHHGGGAQGVAGASEVVPLDAVELPDVVADGVINTVQVGEAAGVEPPT